MVSQVIKYEDFNGEDREKTAYFNLSKAELFELEAEMGGHLAERIARMRENHDAPEFIRLMSAIIKKAYGEKSLDGQRMMKSDDIWLAFYQSPAYDEFFTDILTDDAKNAAFMVGVIPKKLQKDVTEEMAKQGITLPPQVVSVSA